MIDKPQFQRFFEPQEDGYTALLKFSSHQPKSEHHQKEYAVSQFYVESHLLSSTKWIEVAARDLGPDGVLADEESIIVPLHLVTERKHCDFRVTMCYDKIGRVTSDIFSPQAAVEPVGELRIIIQANMLHSWQSPMQIYVLKFILKAIYI